MPSIPERFPMGDAAARDLKLNGGDQTSTQPYHAAPPSTDSFPNAGLPNVSQDRSDSHPHLSQQQTHTRPKESIPSPPLAPTTPIQSRPARSDSLSNRQSALPANDAKGIPPRTNSVASATFSSPQSAHSAIASRSISVSDRSSNGDTFSSLGTGSYLSSKSSKSSFAGWDVPVRNQSVSGKRNVQELAPVEEKNLTPSSQQDAAAQDPKQQATPVPAGIDIARRDYGDDSFEDEANPADQIIYEIMSHIKRIPDLVAAAQVNTGFYGVFCDRGIDLAKSIVLDNSPAAWEYMETAYITPEHPSPYVRNHRQASACVSALKNTLFLRCESTLKPDTMEGLMGVSHDKEQRVDAALWRIWTFCEIFGGESGRDQDSQSQMAWLQHGSDAAIRDKPAQFGVGNAKGLSAPELLLMAELWNALSVLLQESFRLPSEDHRQSLFAQTDAQYPEELYLLEWVSHVMMSGLGAISALASGSFEVAQNLGFTNWSPPREFGRRQAFLKTAVAQTYRRRLQEDAEAKAAAAGHSMRATHRALATAKRRPIVSPAVSSEHVRNQTGLVPRKSIGSGSSTRAEQQLPTNPPQILPQQPPPIPQYNVARPRPAPVPQYNPAHRMGLLPRPPMNYSRPEDVHGGMVSFLDPETRPGSTVNHQFSPYAQHSSPSLSAESSERSYHTHTPSSPPLHVSGRQPLPPSSHKYAVVDPVDKALALLVDQMGFSVAASKKALAASDDGSGLNTNKAISLLQESVQASSMEKIPVFNAQHVAKPSPRFGGMKFMFSSKTTPHTGTEHAPPMVKPLVATGPPQSAATKKTFGELRPTKKERTAYANLTSEEAKGMKSDVFRARVYKETFGNLFHGARDDSKSRKGSDSIISFVEAEGRPMSPGATWSVRSLDARSISSRRRETVPAAADARSLKS